MQQRVRLTCGVREVCTDCVSSLLVLMYELARAKRGAEERTCRAGGVEGWRLVELRASCRRVDAGECGEKQELPTLGVEGERARRTRKRREEGQLAGQREQEGSSRYVELHLLSQGHERFTRASDRAAHEPNTREQPLPDHRRSAVAEQSLQPCSQLDPFVAGQIYQATPSIKYIAASCALAALILAHRPQSLCLHCFLPTSL